MQNNHDPFVSDLILHVVFSILPSFSLYSHSNKMLAITPLLALAATAFAAPTVYTVGDSTMAKNGGGAGWSDGTPLYCSPLNSIN